VGLVERIRRTLRPNGILLCRLNSTKDHHFGAVGHERIAENFYLVRGAPKRFFDLESIDKLFAAGWNRLTVQESVIDRYIKAKTAWEIVLERATLAHRQRAEFRARMLVQSAAQTPARSLAPRKGGLERQDVRPDEPWCIK
jgi:hypothetical protein